MYPVTMTKFITLVWWYTDQPSPYAIRLHITSVFFLSPTQQWRQTFWFNSWNSHPDGTASPALSLQSSWRTFSKPGRSQAHRFCQSSVCTVGVGGLCFYGFKGALCNFFTGCKQTKKVLEEFLMRETVVCGFSGFVTFRCT